MLASALGACGGGGEELSADATLRVYLSLPLRGPSGVDGRDAADGARLALADAGDEAGGVAVEAVLLDDTAGPAARARWTPAQAGANARAATQDSTAIGYLGEFESGATRASLPLTNEARILQVSPASAAIDLVAPLAGSEQIPDLQVTGERTFGRVIPNDDAQAAAAARWVREMGLERVAALSDGSRFGDEVVAAFRETLEGVEVSPRRPEALFFGGEPAAIPAAPSFEGERIVTDAQLTPEALPLQEPGTLATSAALDPTQLPPAGRAFAGDFEAEYGRPPGRYAAYGYEAMALILDAIDRSADPTDRPSVVAAFFDGGERDSILGSYSIDELGETTLDRITGYEIDGGRPVAVAELSSGDPAD